MGLKKTATGGRLLGGWATGDARADSWPVSGSYYPEVTGCDNNFAGCGVIHLCLM